MSPDRTDAPIRVLLADDEPLLRRSLSLILDSQPDLSVVAGAATGTEAVLAARRHRPDIVLMDIRMPGGDGIQATREIAADPSLGETRIIVLSMYELDEYVYGALDAGASGFLLKDAHPGALIDAIRRVRITEALYLSINTVKTHIGNLLAKLHARDRAQLVIAAYQRGLVN